MRPRIKSIYRMVVLVLFLGSFVFAGIGRAETKSNDVGVDKALKDIGKALGLSDKAQQKNAKPAEAKAKAQEEKRLKAEAKARAKAEATAKKKAEADKKKRAKAEREKVKAEAKAELAKAQAKMKSDLAGVDKEAKAQAKARAEDKKKIEKDYRSAITKADSEYKAANKRVEKRAKDAGVDRLGALFPSKKQAAILKSINKDKAKIKAEYESAKAKAKAGRDRSIAALDSKAKSQAKEIAQEKATITKDYEGRKSEINLKLNAEEIAAKAKAQEEKRLKAEAKARAKAEATAKKKAEADKKKRAKAEREEAKAEKEAELAKAEREKKLRLSRLEAKAKADTKAMAEESAKIEKEYKSAKAKVKSQYKKAKRPEADAEAKAKSELAQAKAKMDSDLAGVNKKAKRQATELSEEKGRIKNERKTALAQAESEHKKAKKKLEKQRKDAGVDGIGALFADKKKAAIIKSINKEGTKVKAEYKGVKSRIEAEYKQAMAKLEFRSKAQAKENTHEKKRIANEYKRKEAQVKSDLKYEETSAKAEATAKKRAKADKKKRAKAEREKVKADTKAELAKAQKKMDSDLAGVDKEAKRQAKARAEDKKKIKKDYRSTITKADSEYKAANKRVKKRAKDAGVDGLGALFADKKKATILKSINKDKAKIKAEYESAKAKAKAGRDRSIAALDSKAKSQAKEAARGKTRIAKDYEKTKSEIALKLKAEEPKVPKPVAKEKPAWKIEYGRALAKVETGYRKTKSDLKEKKKLVAEKKAEEKAQIGTEYKETVAKGNLKFQYEDAKARCGVVGPIEDDSPRFLVKEIKISGNTLISTADLLESMPAIYVTSNAKGDLGEKQMYDFRILHEIILEPGEAREVSKNTIQGFTRYILSKYQERRYAGIYVYVSAKAVKGAAELEDQILPIQVLEGKVAKVTIDRYDFDRQETEKEVLKGSVLKSWSPVKEGQVIKKKELDDFVRLLNLNPDRYISPVISRGDKPDTLNLGYDVYEANPWHWYVQLDNSGTDERQWNPRVGVVNTNLTGRDDSFAFMYQAPPDGLEKNYSLFGNYEFPFLTPRLRLGFYAGYSKFEITPEGGGGIINFRGDGSFYGGTLRYNVLQMNDWFFDFLGSLSHESSKVTPSLGIATDTDMDLFGLGGEIHRSDNMSSTSLSFNRLESFSASSEEDFMMARLNSDPDFSIYVLSAAHKQFLDKSKIHELSGSFKSITSDHRLIPAKMTTFGGLYSVRGYQEDEIVADGGILASLQYRFDLTKYLEEDESGNKEKQPTYKKKAWPPNVSLLAFVDHGRAKVKDPVPGEEGAQELLGAGLGTAVELGDHVYGAVYYSWPMRATDDTNKGDGRWNFNFIYRW